MMRALAVALALLWPAAASAHDVWLTLAADADGRRAIVNYGHPDDRPPAVAAKVIDLVAVGANKMLRSKISMGVAQKIRCLPLFCAYEAVVRRAIVAPE